MPNMQEWAAMKIVPISDRLRTTRSRPRAGMDVVQIVKELRAELERIDKLIAALEGLQAGRSRGRPPKVLQELRDRVDDKDKPAKSKKSKKKS